jgi:hypothetical protein
MAATRILRLAGPFVRHYASRSAIPGFAEYLMQACKQKDPNFGRR